ncbi:ALMS1 protein, partial [Centropus unirufus]|nr:ALMS1 protein [Centropus unirufus]
YSRDQELDTERFDTPGDRSFHSNNHTPTTRPKELVEPTFQPAELFHGADLPDCRMQFKTPSAVQTPVCNQHQAVPASHADIELHPAVQKEWDMITVRSAAASESQARKKLSMEKGPEELVKQITSITFSSRKRLHSSLTSTALSSSPTGGDLEGIMPLEVNSGSAEEQSHAKEHVEGSKSCPSPVLAGLMADEIAYGGEKDSFHPVSADRNGVGAYQGTDCLSDGPSGSIHADKRQTLSAKRSDVPPQDVTEVGRHGSRLTGLDWDTRVNQEMNRFQEPHAMRSYQEISSPRGHVPLVGSLEGSGPTVRSDLLKGPIKVLEEEKASPPHAVPFIQKETAREQIRASDHASTDGILSTTSAPPSSPAKKVLSGVHITLSSKVDNSEPQWNISTETGMRSRDEPDVDPQPVSLKPPETLTTNSKFSAADLVPEDRGSSSFPMVVSSAGPCLTLPSATGPAGKELPLQSSERPQGPLPGSRGLNLDNLFTVPTNIGRSTSDAATQITTESPGRTTFSAEIYVHSHNGEKAPQQSSLQQARGLPDKATSSLTRVPTLLRHDQPLLLPYKPSGSSGMYYVPYIKAGSKPSPVGSETSAESLHSGPHDALPPRVPASVLGLRDADPRGSTSVKDKGGIYSQRAKPKLAWAEERMGPQEPFPDPSKPVKPTHSIFKPARLLHQPVARSENFLLSDSKLLEEGSGIGHTRGSSSTVLPYWRNTHHHHQRVFSSCRKKHGETKFFPLTAEVDCSKGEDLNVSRALGDEAAGKECGRREAEQRTGRTYPLPCSKAARHNENMEKDLGWSMEDLPPRAHSSRNLDELWVKFLERQKRPHHHDLRRNGELSLVERLDRLAKVLQNPLKHTLIPPKPEMNVSEETMRGRGQKNIRLPEKSTFESIAEPNAACLEERPRVTHEKRNFVELRRNRSGEKPLYHMNTALEHQQCLETPSDASSEMRLSRHHGTTMSSTTSESDAAMPTEMESASPAEVSSSVSTIDTSRLIGAFGHERVRVSARLSQLYETINHQKSRLEKWDKGYGKAVGGEYLKVASQRHRKRKELQATSISSDSTSTTSGSLGPSSALATKRRTRMLNKGIQAGDLEIVSSATKRNTRDVGLTFPPPGPNEPTQQPQAPWHRIEGTLGKSDGAVTAQRTAGSNGISWFIQAEDTTSESRKENHSKAFSGPGPSWFEPWRSTKPWREPLREKNWQEQKHGSIVHPAVPERDAERRPLRPFVKLTLQEALAAHRPDFISRSGERVKHLKLVMEERRIQSVLQSEREELFNPPGKRKGYGNASDILFNRGLLTKENRRTIPKNEMVQRSKRIYEQLPEVQKKREEERRKMEYRSYRLKAQLYKAVGVQANNLYWN